MAIIQGPGYTTVAPRKVVTAPKAPVVRGYVPPPATRAWANVMPTTRPVPAGRFSYAQQLATPVPQLTAATQTTPPGTTTSVVPRSAVPSNFIASLQDIMGHPLSVSALGAYNTDMQSLMRALRSNISGKIVTGGYDPTAAFKQLMASRPDLGEFTDLIDPAAIATANQNPLSEKALNEQTYNRMMSNLDYNLAARGIQGSGAQATGGNQILQTRQLAENQSRQGFLDALQSGITGYLGQKTAGYNKLQDVYSQVAQLLAQQQGATPEEGTAMAETPSTEETVIPGTNVPSAAAKPAGYLNWFNMPIRSVNQMKQELAKRGQNWNTWAPLHPAAVAQLQAMGG